MERTPAVAALPSSFSPRGSKTSCGSRCPENTCGQAPYGPRWVSVLAPDSNRCGASRHRCPSHCLSHCLSHRISALCTALPTASPTAVPPGGRQGRQAKGTSACAIATAAKGFEATARSRAAVAVARVDPSSSSSRHEMNSSSARVYAIAAAGIQKGTASSAPRRARHKKLCAASNPGWRQLQHKDGLRTGPPVPPPPPPPRGTLRDAPQRLSVLCFSSSARASAGSFASISPAAQNGGLPVNHPARTCGHPTPLRGCAGGSGRAHPGPARSERRVRRSSRA